MSTEPQSIVDALKTAPPVIRSDHKPYPVQEKMQIFAALIAGGFDPVRAHAIVNGKKKTTKAAVKRAKAKVESYVLAQPHRIVAAELAIDDTLAMQPVEIVNKKGELEFLSPTVSNRLDAAKMVMDRADVIPQVHLSIEYSPLEMAEFELIPASKVIDQVAETVISEEDQEVTI